MFIRPLSLSRAAALRQNVGPIRVDSSQPAIGSGRPQAAVHPIRQKRPFKLQAAITRHNILNEHGVSKLPYAVRILGQFHVKLHVHVTVH
jgi:hypothetical protein